MFTLLRQRRLRWLEHVAQMKDGRIYKDILYGELVPGKCNFEPRQLNIDLKNWGELAMDRSRWRSNLRAALKVGDQHNHCLR